jgi:hypothetical protein
MDGALGAGEPLLHKFPLLREAAREYINRVVLPTEGGWAAGSGDTRQRVQKRLKKWWGGKIGE